MQPHLIPGQLFQFASLAIVASRWCYKTALADDCISDDALYGLNMLVFDDSCKITTVRAFRQFTVKESLKLVKPELQSHFEERV